MSRLPFLWDFEFWVTWSIGFKLSISLAWLKGQRKVCSWVFQPLERGSHQIAGLGDLFHSVYPTINMAWTNILYIVIYNRANYIQLIPIIYYATHTLYLYNTSSMSPPVQTEEPTLHHTKFKVQVTATHPRWACLQHQAFFPGLHSVCRLPTPPLSTSTDGIFQHKQTRIWNPLFFRKQ